MINIGNLCVFHNSFEKDRKVRRVSISMGRALPVIVKGYPYNKDALCDLAFWNMLADYSPE